MGYHFPPDLEILVREKMASGNYVSEDELLRDAFAALCRQDDDLLAVQDAITAWQEGDQGVELDAAFDAIRQTQRGREES